MLLPQETLWMQRILLRKTDIGLFYSKVILDFLRKEWRLCSLASRYKAHSSAYSKSKFEPILINSATKVSMSYIYVSCNQKNTSIAGAQTHFPSWSLCHIHSDTIINQSQHLAWCTCPVGVLPWTQNKEEHSHFYIIYVVISNLQSTFTGEISTLYFFPLQTRFFL